MNDHLHIFTLTGDGAFAVDQNKRIVFWNEAAENMFGYKAEEVLNRVCYEVMRGITLDGIPFCQHQCAFFEDGKPALNPPHNFDLIMHHRSGHGVRVNISTIRLPGQPHTAEQVSLLRLRQEPLAWDKMLRVHLLGPMQVWRPDGTQVKGKLWQRQKVRALFAYLALNQGQPVPRETLIDLLWPEMDVETARHNLNTTVYNLRRSLEPKLKRVSDSYYVLYEDGSYLLYGDGRHWMDVHEFTHILHQARQEQDRRQAIKLYTSAIDMVQGDYLEDLMDMGVFSFGEQTRLRHLYLSAMESIGQLYEAISQESEAENWYLKVLAVDPCSESACQKLMQLSIQRNRLAEAAAHYQRLARALARELNVEPSPETRRLQRVVQQYDPDS